MKINKQQRAKVINLNTTYNKAFKFRFYPDDDGSFTLPKFNKPLNIKFSRDFDRSKVSSVTVTKEPSGHYYISFLSQANYQR